MSLDWLLEPVDRETFLSSYWESRALHVARDAPDRFARLPGQDAVDELLTATTFASARSAGVGQLVRALEDGGREARGFRVTPAGVVDIQDVYRAYEDGFSVVLNGLHCRSARVAALCRALEDDLHHPVGANMYLTPRGAQGFPPHTDTHDVFILQLHGEKDWHVASADTDLPLARARGPEEDPVLDQRLTLRPGDVLYIPRGVPHEAVTSGSSSLHLTVGIHVYRLADLLSEVVAVLAEERVSFRRALPGGFLDAPADERLPAIAAEVTAALAENGVAERAQARLAARLRASAMAAQPGQFRSIDRLGSLTAETVVAHRPGSLCSVHRSGDEATIEFAGNFVAGPAAIEPALRFVAERERFAVGELPGPLAPDDRTALVGRLISEGLLFLP